MLTSKNQEVVKLKGNIINPEVIKSVGNATVSVKGWALLCDAHVFDGSVSVIL